MNLLGFALAAHLGCAGQPAKSNAPTDTSAETGNAAALPLEVGADYASYTKVNKDSFESPTHGHRFVDIFVNDVGLAAYKSDQPMPVGSIVVKTSFENAGGKRSDVAGPIFIMQKREAGFAPDHADWYYAMHWQNVPQNWQSKVGAPSIYWQTPSSKVDYCSDCHDNYDRELGMPPAAQRTW